MPAFVRIVVAVGGNDAKDVAPFLAIPELRASSEAPEPGLDVVLLGGAASDWAIRLAESKGHLVTVVPGQWSPSRALAHFAGSAHKLYLLPSAAETAFTGAGAQGYEVLRYARDDGGWTRD